MHGHVEGLGHVVPKAKIGQGVVWVKLEVSCCGLALPKYSK